MNRDNPFYVLELPPEATTADVERQGRKLLGMLELGTEKAKRYVCPLGGIERDATMVREAMAALRDPETRAAQAILARLLDGASEVDDEAFDAPMRDAFAAGGYRGF